MATSFAEWMLRMVMLVLAGLVTLSILSSLAAISNDAGDGLRQTAKPTEAPADRPPATELPQAAEAGRAAERETAPVADPVPEAAAGSAPAASSPEPTDRWLEAIAYALLALAGLFALAILLLWRSLRQLRRIADASEARRAG
jgi:hypothetical protein